MSREEFWSFEVIVQKPRPLVEDSETKLDSKSHLTELILSLSKYTSKTKLLKIAIVFFPKTIFWSGVLGFSYRLGQSAQFYRVPLSFSTIVSSLLKLKLHVRRTTTWNWVQGSWVSFRHLIMVILAKLKRWVTLYLQGVQDSSPVTAWRASCTSGRFRYVCT